MASRHSDDWIERSCRPSEPHAPIDAMARGDVAVDQRPGEGLQVGFVVMRSCDVESRITGSMGSSYAPNGSCFYLWADAGETDIFAGRAAPTSGSGVITRSTR